MIVALIGISLSFLGAFAIVIETISGESIRPRIYYKIYKGVYQFTGDYTPPIKIKLYPKEIRILIWIILMILGFSLQISSFFT